MSDRHFVFLQGMPSPFFSRIANALHARGCEVTGINFCMGDWLYWHGPGTLNYRGKLTDWPGFFENFLMLNQVTDLVLLGEQRSYHKPAVRIAQAHGVKVTVTDFGYLRPDWITLERDGMTGASKFPREPAQIQKLAAETDEIDLNRKYKDSSWNMGVADHLYNFSNLFFGWLYPHYRRSDKRPSTVIYVLAGARRYLLTKLFAWKARAVFSALMQSAERFYIFPLQLEHDFQIVAYSPFPTQEIAIQKVIQSFARNSAVDVRLVIKVHPWDPGLKNWQKLVARVALEHGVAGRVDFFDDGDLDAMILRSLGMVTINSTSGLRALQLGCRVKVLGQAIYDVPGLTFQGNLDHFWQDANLPDPQLSKALIQAMAATIQIRGVFFKEPGLTAAVNEAVDRLYGDTVGLPA